MIEFRKFLVSILTTVSKSTGILSASGLVLTDKRTEEADGPSLFDKTESENDFLQYSSAHAEQSPYFGNTCQEIG